MMINDKMEETLETLIFERRLENEITAAIDAALHKRGFTPLMQGELEVAAALGFEVANADMWRSRAGNIKRSIRGGDFDYDYQMERADRLLAIANILENE